MNIIIFDLIKGQRKCLLRALPRKEREIIIPDWMSDVLSAQIFLAYTLDLNKPIIVSVNCKSPLRKLSNMKQFI
jgi:hypothetical protein